jgi:hypothetical protein
MHVKIRNLVACMMVRWLLNTSADETAKLVFDSAKEFTLDDSYLESANDLSENDDSVSCIA